MLEAPIQRESRRPVVSNIERSVINFRVNNPDWDPRTVMQMAWPEMGPWKDEEVAKAFLNAFYMSIRSKTGAHGQLHEEKNDEVYKYGVIEADVKDRRIRVNDANLHTTNIEFHMLKEMIKKGGELLTQEELFGCSRGSIQPIDKKMIGNNLRFYIGRLRKKLAGVADKLAIETQHGIGYRLLYEDPQFPDKS